MAIIRTDKRLGALKRLAECRTLIDQALGVIDVLQDSIDDLEVDLGLASEGEQTTRERYAVMHFPAGNGEGHSMTQCETIGCDAASLIQHLSGDEEKPPEGI